VIFDIHIFFFQEWFAAVSGTLHRRNAFCRWNTCVTGLITANSEKTSVTKTVSTRFLATTESAFLRFVISFFKGLVTIESQEFSSYTSYVILLVEHALPKLVGGVRFPVASCRRPAYPTSC